MPYCTDTLSLSRLGGDATGVDFSEVAIAEARQLSQDLVFAAFEVRDRGTEIGFPRGLDLVFTSHGVLTWLSDLGVWARDLAGCRSLKDGFIFEGHPLVWAFADEQPVDSSVSSWAILICSSEPSIFVEPGSYANQS